MTAQEIIDRVAKHLIEQGQPAFSGGRCLYRSPSGNSCAVGCLIPDDSYSEDFEGLTVDSLDDRPSHSRSSNHFSNVMADLHLLEHKDLLIDLQSAHDEYAYGTRVYGGTRTEDKHTPEAWRTYLANSFAKICAAHNLTIPAIFQEQA